MISWPLVALSDVFDIARGGSPRPIDDYVTDDPNGINWIMIGDANEGTKYITGTKRRIRTEGAQRSRAVKPGDFLLTNSMSFGKPYILGTSGCIHDGWLVLSPRRRDVDADFFYHLLGSDAVYAEFERRASGATVKNLNIDLVKGVKVPLPPLREQRRIAEILDMADALRAKRRSALAQLDTLTQSIFFDMFGDPATNPKGIQTSPLGDLIRLKSGDFLPASEMALDGAYPVLGGNGITGFHNRHMFEEPQIVIGRVGVYCGCVHTAPQKSWITDNALFVSERDPTLRFEYLVHALRHARLNQYASQSGQPLVSGSRIYPVKILLPPKELQISFEERIAGVKEVERRCDAGRTGLDRLFASLQHRAFRGAL